MQRPRDPADVQGYKYEQADPRGVSPTVTRIDLVTSPGTVTLKKGFEYKLELPEGQELRGWYEKDPAMDADTLEEPEPPGEDDAPF